MLKTFHVVLLFFVYAWLSACARDGETVTPSNDGHNLSDDTQVDATTPDANEQDSFEDSLLDTLTNVDSQTDSPDQIIEFCNPTLNSRCPCDAKKYSLCCYNGYKVYSCSGPSDSSFWSEVYDTDCIQSNVTLSCATAFSDQ